MVHNAGHFGTFEPHTQLKHEILRTYVERWARVLLMHAKESRSRIRIVDACAGAGQDESGKPGSPLISIREAEQAQNQLARLRGFPVEIQVTAIEKDRGRYEQLAAMVGVFGGRHRAWQGTLADHSAALEADPVPTLFFIDPFGLEPLQADVVRQALAGPKNEVLLLFADQAALRHIGAAATLDEPHEVQPSLFASEGTAATHQPGPSREQKLTGEAAIRIMTAAFGHEGWRAVLDLPASLRRQALVDMYAELLGQFGAERVLALPIIGQRSHLKYHLIFGTHSGKGYEVMKDAVERAWGAELVDKRAVELMQLGTATPVSAIVEMVLARFAGSPATSWRGDRPGESIRSYLLQDTAAMPHQFKEVKDRLAQYRVPGKALVYRFPPY